MKSFDFFVMKPTFDQFKMCNYLSFSNKTEFCITLFKEKKQT